MVGRPKDIAIVHHAVSPAEHEGRFYFYWMVEATKDRINIQFDEGAPDEI
jgi:hypothetical protein